MAVTARASGTVNVSGTAVGSIATTTGAGILAGDLTLLGVVVKPFSATIGEIDGWTKMTEFVSGSTVNGAESGSTKTAAFIKIGAAASTVVSVGPSLGGGVDTATAGCVTYQNATGFWFYDYVTGADDAYAANFSATSGANLPMDNGDMHIAVVGLNSDNGTTSSIQMQGTTSGITTRQTALTNTGNDSKLMISDRAQSSSTNTTVGYSYTNTSSTAGGVIFVKLSERPARNPVRVDLQYLRRAANW